MKLFCRLKERIHEIIFETDTREGKVFDVALLILISCSVILIMLESVKSYDEEYGFVFDFIEWTLTIIFSVEYVLRIWVVKNSRNYIFSMMGIIDLLAIIPTYLSIFIVTGHYIAIVRIFRLLRVFRVLKLVRYMQGAETLKQALISTRGKIVAFLVFVLCSAILMGTVMYVVEGGENGFNSIPRSVYWAIVTLTTVGYGDISPATGLGQAIASLIMVLGYGVLAVPTGLVSVEAIKIERSKISSQVCMHCNDDNHHVDATYCKSCGERLNS